MKTFNFERGETRDNLESERGRDVQIILKFIRHGERGEDGLTDYGRKVTRQHAQDLSLKSGKFDAIKAIGSSAGAGMSAFETANVYAQELSGEKTFNPRIRNILSHETLKNTLPFNSEEIYKANLPEDFNLLSDQDKVKATSKAKKAVLNYAISLDTPEAEACRKEAAGAFASLIVHYQKMGKKLKSGSKVLIPAGTHGGNMEFLLQQTLIRKDNKGSEVVGFKNIDDIGGTFEHSEAYNVDIKTDENGDDKLLQVSFDNNARSEADLRLDYNKVKELAQYYEDLHKDDNEN